MASSLPLMNCALTSLTVNVLIPLGLSVRISAADAAIQKYSIPQAQQL